MEYKVVDSTLHKLVELVNNHIRDGWNTCGGLCAYGQGEDGEDYFAQAMVRHHRQSLTAFPWESVSIRTAKAVMRAVNDKTVYRVPNVFSKYEWPMSCEDLLQVGAFELLQLRNFGLMSLNEINSRLISLGFSTLRKH